MTQQQTQNSKIKNSDMKYIFVCTVLSFTLSFILINCARAKYRHPADPHAPPPDDATPVRNSDAECAHYSDYAERAYVAQLMQYADSIADEKHSAIITQLRNTRNLRTSDNYAISAQCVQYDTVCEMRTQAVLPDTFLHQ